MDTTTSQATITDEIVAANLDRIEIAQAFDTTEEDVAELQREVDQALQDEDVTEDEFHELCASIDSRYTRVA